VKDVGDGVVGVVGDGEGFDSPISVAHGCASFEEFPWEFAFEFILEGFGSECVCEVGEVFVFGEASEASGVISMFVSEKDGVDITNILLASEQEFFNTFAGESYVDEDLAFGCFEISAVTGTTAA
jgi:hypothetical protein